MGIDVLVRRTGAVCPEAGQSSEGHGSIEAAVEAKRKLVHIRLEMLRTNAMKRAGKPSLEIGGDGGEHRQPGIHPRTTAAHGKRLVTETTLA